MDRTFVATDKTNFYRVASLPGRTQTYICARLCVCTVFILLLPPFILSYNFYLIGRASSVGIATRYRMDGPGIESRWGEIFRARPDRPWGPSSLLYSGYRVSFPGVKRPGRGVDHPLPFSAEVKERVELYIYPPLWAFVACYRVNFTFLYRLLIFFLFRNTINIPIRIIVDKHILMYIYRVIQNNFRSFNNLSYTIHLR